MRDFFFLGNVQNRKGHLNSYPMTCYELRNTNHELRVTNYELRVTNYELRVTDNELLDTNYFSQLTNYKGQIKITKWNAELYRQIDTWWEDRH